MSILGVIDFITTVIKIKPPTISQYQIQLFVWCVLITNTILLIFLVLIASITILLTDHKYLFLWYWSRRRLNFISISVLILQLPEVYLLVLPGFAIISHVVVYYSGKKGFRNIGIVWVILYLGVRSYWEIFNCTGGQCPWPWHHSRVNYTCKTGITPSIF